MKNRESQLKKEIVRKLKMIRKVESPIVRYRLENEIDTLSSSLDTIYLDLSAKKNHLHKK